MRRITRVLLSTCLLASGAVLLADDTDTVSVTTTMTVTPLGDGTMTMKRTYTAAQFRQFKEQYGDDQGLLKRDLTRGYLGTMDLSDWNIQIDSVNRSLSLSVKMHGVVIPRGGGAFQFPIPKSWKGGERNGTNYSYNFAEAGSDGGIMQDNVKLIFPANSTRFSEDKNETGDTVVTYHVPTGAMTGILLYAGAGFLAIGLLLIILAAALMKSPRPVHA